MPARILLLLTIAFALVTGPACPLSICGVLAKEQPSCGHCCPPGQDECCEAGETSDGRAPLAVEPAGLGGKDLAEPVRTYLGLLPQTAVPEISSERSLAWRPSARSVLARTCVRLI